jgi:hypothetical protein
MLGQSVASGKASSGAFPSSAEVMGKAIAINTSREVISDPRAVQRGAFSPANRAWYACAWPLAQAKDASIKGSRNRRIAGKIDALAVIGGSARSPTILAEADSPGRNATLFNLPRRAGKGPACRGTKHPAPLQHPKVPLIPTIGRQGRWWRRRWGRRWRSRWLRRRWWWRRRWRRWQWASGAPAAQFFLQRRHTMA